MNNYRDVSSGSSETGAGFQFEFSCQHCDRTWRSPFKAYKRGRVSAWLDWLTFSISGTAAYAARRGIGGLAHVGMEGARKAALANALAAAQANYTECTGCRKWLCTDCADRASGLCPACRGEASRATHLDGDAGPAGAVCPSCERPTGGGRFCEGCGFDLASTHKSCPGCGAMMARQARFCTDCGHGF